MAAESGRSGGATLSQRLRYRFDNLMARGVAGQMSLLVVLSAVIMAVLVLLTFVASQIFGGTGEGFGPVVAKIFMLILVPDPVDLENGRATLFVAYTLSIIGGLFVGGTLIGILATAIDGKMDELRRGRSFVAEDRHTVILGWSSKIFRIVDEIVIANENHPGQCIVILAKRDSVEMADEIVERVEDFRGTHVVCRTGNPIVTQDLELVNLRAARSVIVLSPEDKADADAHIIKILLTLAKLMQDRAEKLDLVVEIRDRRNQRVCEIIAGQSQINAVPLVPDVVIPRLLVQSCRKKGLSYVYQELFDFAGDEIYLCPMSDLPTLVDKSFGELLFCFDDSSIIGVLKDGRILINPDFDTVCRAGDELISISEDDDTTLPSGMTDYGIQEDCIESSERVYEARPENNLILGWTDHIFSVIRELDNYVQKGSKLTLVSSFPGASDLITQRCQNVRNHEFHYQEGHTGDRRFLESLPFETFDNILVLPDWTADERSYEDMDAVTIKSLVHLQDIARKGGIELSITTQMMAKESSDVAETTRLGDFVVSDEIMGRIIAQLAEDSRLKDVLDILLTAEGSEIYIKPMKHYVIADRAVNFYTVLESAKRIGEIAIGFIRGEVVEVNPCKSKRYTFQEGDKVVVVALD